MRLVTTLDRLVARQVIVPATLGFVVYTFLLLMQGLFSLAEQIFVRGLPLRDAGAVLLATLPHVVVLTIPMGYLFGVLIAVGRMNADNETIALQAGGISVRRMLRPILALGLALTLLGVYLFTVVIPNANRDLRDLRLRLFTSAKNIGRIEPKVFYEDFPNLLLYVRHVDDDGTWRDVFAYDSSDPGQERLILASRGHVVVAGPRAPSQSRGTDVNESVSGSQQPWIMLKDATTYQFLRSSPETYRVNRNEEQLFKPRIEQPGVIHYNPAMRERKTGELVRFLAGGDLTGQEGMSPEDRRHELRLAGLELNRRLAIPAASAVFALLALPLGVGSRAGARGRGFVLSVGVVLAYYVMNNHGELLAAKGKIPVWLGIWLPNIVLTVIALILMVRMGRWLGERHPGAGIMARTVKAWREWRRRRRARRMATGMQPGSLTGSIPLPLQRRTYAFGFPTLLDRYVTRRLMGPLALVVVSTSLLYVVVDLTDRIDDISAHGASLKVVLGYYWNLVPQVILDIIPFALLIGLLIVLTVLERQQELTALKGAGISLFRLMIPVLLVATLGSGLMWTLSESIVPRANREKERLLDRIRGRTTARSYSAAHRQWLLSRDDSTFYNFLRYDAESQTLFQFTQFRVDQNMHLRFSLFAHRVRYVNGAWIADSGWYREIAGDGSETFHPIDRPRELGIAEGPTYFGQEYRGPDEMSFGELHAYIRELEASGYRPHKLLVRWYQKLSYPLSAIVMVCLGLPFALNRGGRRVTTMQGVALALALGIGFYLLTAVFGKLGEAAVLPALLAAWAPTALALLFALNRMTTLRT